MIDEIYEVGFYSFHIRLYNDDKTSRVTLPPVMKGIEIREPLVIEEEMLPEDDENSVCFRRLYFEDTDLPSVTINLEGGNE